MEHQTRTWKTGLIGAGICAVLSLQAAAQVLDTGGAFWPFMPYHMYSNVYQAGAEIAFYDLRVVADPGTAPTSLSFRDAGIPEYKYAGLLRAAATRSDHLLASGEDGAVRYLGDVLSRAGRSGEVELWELRYRIGPDGLELRTPEETLIRQWFLPLSEAR